MADAIISASGMRIIKMLVGNTPRTINDLVDLLDVTRNAVTEQLNELVRAGFVERQTQRPYTRGRPQYLYKASRSAALILYAQSQCMVVPAIWKAIEDLGGDELLRKVMRKVSKSLAEHYNAKVTARKPEERLRQLMKLLNAEGGLTETAMEKGSLVLRKRSCPFLRILDEKRTICCVDVEMMSQVVGKSIRPIACRHDGADCCAFEIAD
jgi:predicted ArsR family transcriptional regulator